MHQGNWTCSKCGGSITELPFEPKSTQGLVCRSCYSSKQGNGGTSGGGENAGNAGGGLPAASQGSAAQAGERKMYEGNWKCAECGNAINKLPFEPKSTNNLRCIDCYKKGQG